MTIRLHEFWIRMARPRKEDARGYRKLFLDTVTQADRGCDFDFLAQPGTIRVPSR